MRIEKTEKGVWLGTGDGGFNIPKDVALQLAHRIIELLDPDQSAQQSVQADGAYCTCENSNFFVSDLGLTCWTCKKPRR